MVTYKFVVVRVGVYVWYGLWVVGRGVRLVVNGRCWVVGVGCVVGCGRVSSGRWMASELSLSVLVVAAVGWRCGVVLVYVRSKIYTHYQNLKFVTLSLSLTITSPTTTFTIYFISHPSTPIHNLEIIQKLHYLSVIRKYVR